MGAWLRESTNTKMQSGPSEKANLLLVDDREENLKTLEAILEDLGENLVFASSGPEALRHVLQMDFAVILMDVRMPGMDGLEAAALIRQRDRSAHTPIIFLTAYDENQDQVKKGYGLGAVDFLFKPIVPEILRSKLAVFVDLHRKTEEIQRTGEILREAQLRAHERELAEQRRKWETEQLRKEVERERETTARLQESYARLQELERLRDDLTSMVVHDLRTPLASLITGLQLVESLGELNEEQAEMLRMSVSSGQNLLRIINDLLDISKMESGSMNLELESADPVRILKDSLAQVAHLAREKEIDLTSVSNGSILPLRCDRDKMTRALVNLLGNGLKFTPKGGAVTAAVDQEDAEVVFSVEDTGEGIPPESLERIFDKFGQVENRKSGRRMSTGLGLTFCKMIVEAHGGRIDVESNVGKGSKFMLRIPLTAGAE